MCCLPPRVLRSPGCAPSPRRSCRPSTASRWPSPRSEEEAMMHLRTATELAVGQRQTALLDLPEWDLSDLYPGRDSEALARDLTRLADDAEAFRERYQGRLADLSGAALGAAIETYERLQEQSGRIISYASLVHAGNLTDPEIGRFFQTMQERINAISTTLLFFTLELNRIEDADLEAKQADPALARYHPWLRDTRAFRPHQLSDEIEKLLHEKYVAGRAAWTRLFDETIADLRFSIRGKELTEAEAIDLLSDTDPEIRREAALAIGEVLRKNARTFALITNTLAKDKEIEDRWRRFAHPISSRNLANFVEDEVVDALIAAVRDSYPRLSHRYYKLKARWFGVDALPLLGPQRAVARGRGPADPLARSRGNRIVGLWGLLARARRGRRAVFCRALDRRAGAARQGVGCLRTSDGAERPSLSAAQLSGPGA